MQTLEAINQRRAVKYYDPSHQMPKAEIEQLISTAMLAPTSFNIQNWRFVVVTDKALREQIKAAAWNQAQVTDASILVIMCADLKSWEKNPERYWANAPQETQKILVPMIGNFYGGREQVQRDEAMRSCGIAAQTLMLTAKDMGYDSCPMIGFDADKVAELINLPKDHVIAMMISIGKAVKPAHARGGQLAIDEVLIWDKF